MSGTRTNPLAWRAETTLKATIAPAMPIKAHNIQAGKNVPKTLNDGQCMGTGDFMKRAKAPPEGCPAGLSESATIATGSRMLPPGIRRCARIRGNSAGNADAVGDDQPQPLADAPSEVRIHLPPEGARPLLDGALDAVAQVRDQVVHQAVALGLRHHVAVEVARLDEIVVLRVQRGRGAHEPLAFDVPAPVAKSDGIGVRSAMAVRRTDRPVAA